MKRISTATLFAIALATTTAVLVSTPAKALGDQTTLSPTQSVDSLKETELARNLLLETSDNLNTNVETDAIGLPRITLDQVADSLQINQESVNATVVDRFNANKPALSNGVVYIIE